jgi:hypothetical protein
VHIVQTFSADLLSGQRGSNLCAGSTDFAKDIGVFYRLGRLDGLPYQVEAQIMDDPRDCSVILLGAGARNGCVVGEN